MTAGAHVATEQRSLDTVLALMPEARRAARAMLARVDRIAPLPPDALIVDVGASQGLFVTACARLGYRAVGVEPWGAAREMAREVAAREGVAIEMVEGLAERLPLASGSVDVVRANSVIEHVVDVESAFAEAFRVLKPGGVFWFSTASSLCPRQGEIRGFPAFGWYPDAVKLRVMAWAKEHRPELIGGTQFPAIHWFTPPKARRLLERTGFSAIYDRWDLRLPSEGGCLYRLLLGTVRSSPLTKLAADVVVPTCSYAAVRARLAGS
ncbi:class I SAM-dependent methyltransferase [bacterium]|nr:MAG: class I SAM-dependent methyltransferase [bacterium]